MAYYNPDNSQPYYNPEESTQYTDQLGSELETPTTGGGIGSILGSLAAFTLGTFLLKTYGGKAIDYGIRSLSKVAKGKAPLLKGAFLKSVFKTLEPITKVADDIVFKAATEKPLVLRDILKGTPKVSKVFKNYEKVVAAPRKAYQEYLTKTQVIKSQLEKTKQFNNFEFQSRKITEFLNKNNRFKRIIGGAEKWTTEYAKSLPVFYAVDRVVSAREYAGEKPSLLNIPGTLLDFTKFGIQWAPMDIGFSAGLKGLGLLRTGITKATQKLLKPYTPGMNKVLDITSEKLSSISRAVSDRVIAAKPILTKINSEIGERFRSHFIGRKAERNLHKRTISSFDKSTTYNKIRESIDEYKYNLQQTKRRIHRTDGIITGRDGTKPFKVRREDVQSLQAIETAYRRLSDISYTHTQKVTLGDEFISKFNKQHRVGKLSTIASITNRKAITRDQSKYNNTYTKFFRRLVDDYGADSREIQLLENTWMKSTYGPSTFKSSLNPSKMVDYSVFNPINILKLAPQLLSKISIRTPFSKNPIKPFSFIAGETIFGKGAKYRTFGKEENYYLGRKHDTNTLLKSESDREGLMTFIGGKFLKYDFQQNKFITPEQIKNKTYLLKPKSEKLQSIQGRERAVTDHNFDDIIRQNHLYDQKGFKKGFRGFLRKMEIGAGLGRTKSIFSRLVGFAEDKLYGVRSDIDRAYNRLNDKNLKTDIITGYESLKENFTTLKGALDTSRREGYHSLSNRKVIRMISERAKMMINVDGVQKKFADFLENEKDVLEFWTRQPTTAPKKVANIIRRYNEGDKHVLTDISSITKFGPALTGMDELKFELLERELIKNAHQGPVFGVKTNKFINDVAKKTGMSKLSLTAINNLGLNVELKALFESRGVNDIASATINDGMDIAKKFINKMKEYDNINLMKLNTYLTKLTGHRKADETLLKINKVIAAKMKDSPYVAIEANGMGVAGTAYKYALERLSDMGGFFGLGMDLTKHTGAAGLTHFWGKRALQFAAIAGTYNLADTFFDSNPLFNQTMLDEGISVSIAEQLAKVRLASAKIGDSLGFTKGAQYMEGLMPGSSNFLPGAIAGGFAAGPIGVLAGGFLNRILGTYFNYNATMNYDELRDIYAGREKIPVRRGRAWELSKTPYEGGRISYYRPSWFHLLKSQYKNNPVLYGGKLESMSLTKPWIGLGFNPIGALLDPYRLERKQYHARPFPTTAPAGVDMPLFGPLFSTTIGKILKPIKSMHPMEMQNTYNGIQGGNWDLAMRANLLESRAHNPNSTAGIALRGGTTTALNPYNAYTTLGEQTYNFTEAAGLIGFLTESTILRGGIGETRAIHESANRMSSIKRQYWDLEMGGGLLTTEFWRRMIPRERKEIERRNPLKNMMPSWLPGGIESNYFINFKGGDAYSKVPLGESRLPGFGLESVRNLKYSFPGRASSLGLPINTMVARMLGIGQETSVETEEILEEGTVMHKAIQRNLKKNNLLIKAEAEVYDIKHDITGHVDAIIRDGIGGGGKRAVEIKTINAKGFNTLRAPKRAHQSQLNFYLSQLKLPVGNLVYVNRDDPSQVKSFNIHFSKNLLEKDMIQLEQSRNLANNLLRQGVRGQNIGEAYSHLDRLEILGDVAPWSKEYKSELKVVSAQRRAGLLSEYDNKKINTIKKHRANVMRRFDFYPKRFSLDQLVDPDTTYTQLAVNENIKAAAEYSLPERLAGSAWEMVTHSDLPFINKFFGYKTPLEHYQQNVMYGSKKSYWQKPYESFIEPAMRGMLGQTTPFGGAAKWAVPGFLFGGPVGAIGMGAIGTAYGAGMGLANSTYLPGRIQKQREISDYFDRLEFEKNKRLHNLTGEDEYLEKMQQTMTGYRTIGGKNYANMFRAVERPEKDYLDAFLKTTNPNERSQILKLIPKDLSSILRNRWRMTDNIDQGFESNKEYFRTHNMPDETWTGWSPHLPISDFQVQTMKMEGLDAHDIGMGWYNQERRIKNSPWKINPIKINETIENPPSIAQNKLYSLINNILKKHGVFGNISIIPIGNALDGVNLRIDATVDRRKDMMKVIRGY